VGKICFLTFLCLLLASLAACRSSGITEKYPSPVVATPGAQLQMPASPAPSITPASQPPKLASPSPSELALPRATASPTLQAPSLQADLNTAQVCEFEWKNTQNPDMLECALKTYQQVIAGADEERKPYIQYLFDKLLWQSGQDKVEARERILEFIRHNLQNDIADDAVEFYWSEILPAPEPYDAGDRLVIYADGIKLPHIVAYDPGASIKIRDTNVPGNLYQGKNAPALEVDWVKNSEAWDSLIVGFDERLADKSVAQAGELISLADPENYRLEFVVKADPGLSLWDDDFLRIKIQDQNLLVNESIGNQLVCSIQLTDDWVAYSIPLTEFSQDRWVIKKFADTAPELWGGHPSLVFDWSRVKQINFDVPYMAHGQGSFILDNIQLVRSGAASDVAASSDNVKTTCVGFPY
jgi:hypothetical protein